MERKKPSAVGFRKKQPFMLLYYSKISVILEHFDYFKVMQFVAI